MERRWHRPLGLRRQVFAAFTWERFDRYGDVTEFYVRYPYLERLLSLALKKMSDQYPAEMLMVSNPSGQ